MPRKMLLVVIAALAAALLVPSLASAARTNVAVGIGDQSPAMFDHPDFLKLKLKKARYFVDYDTMSDPGRLALAEAWVAQARKRGVRPFLHVHKLDIGATTKPPSVRTYRRQVGSLVRHFRKRGVRDWGVWNEANSKTQPTWRSPKKVAKYFLAMRKACKRCTIVALDILDSGSMKSYIRKFYKALKGKKRAAKIVGIHNYGDTNRKRNNTKKIIRWTKRYNRRAKFWFTETGGIAYFATSEKTVFKCSPKRQKRAVAKMFRLARKYRRHVKRLYPYNFFGTDCDKNLRFDSGIMKDRTGTARRPAYRKFRKKLRGFKR